MKAIVVKRKPVRFARARIAAELDSGKGAAHLLRLEDIDEPALPTPEWQRVRPLLAGICGSDLATVDARSSRWFESIVSFPFTPGHEIVGLTDDDRRVVVEPVLGCAPRGLPLCTGCGEHHPDRCERLAVGGLQPGLQTGYCADTGGGWGQVLIAHPSQLHEVPDDLADAEAALVEPAACSIHAALSPVFGTDDGIVAVLGAGTLGLGIVAALKAYAMPDRLVVGARYPEQKAFAKRFGATDVVAGSELKRAIRRISGSFELTNGSLTGGAHVTFDCVGSSASLTDAIDMTCPGGTIVLVGMAAGVQLDLTPLWQKQIRLQGAYAYGVEHHPSAADPRSTFDMALELVKSAGLGDLLSASYPLDRFTDAIEHAAHAGPRGAIKVALAPNPALRSPSQRKAGS